GVIALQEAPLDDAGHREAKDRLWSVDGVPPREWDPRLVAHRPAAANHLPGHLRRQHIHRPAEDGDGHQRVAPHGVDVADGVGGGDAPEVEGVVDNGHEKVGGGHHPPLVVDGVHGGVVLRGVAHPQPGVEVLGAAAGEDGVEHLGGDLATTAGAVAVLGEADGIGHGGPGGEESPDSSKTAPAPGQAPGPIPRRAKSPRISSSTAGSSMVDGTSNPSPSASLRRMARRILPERVLGRRRTISTWRRQARAPTCSRTISTTSASRAVSSMTMPSLSTARARGTWPRSPSAMPITTHSATAGWAATTSSISPVDRRWPATLMTSSVRPITNR